MSNTYSHKWDLVHSHRNDDVKDLTTAAKFQTPFSMHSEDYWLLHKNKDSSSEVILSCFQSIMVSLIAFFFLFLMFDCTTAIRLQPYCCTWPWAELVLWRVAGRLRNIWGPKPGPSVCSGMRCFHHHLTFGAQSALAPDPSNTPVTGTDEPSLAEKQQQKKKSSVQSQQNVEGKGRKLKVCFGLHFALFQTQ